MRLVCKTSFVKLQENPLCPLVVFFIGGVYLSIPIVGKSNHLKLFTKSSHVCGSRFFGMCTSFDGVLLRWEGQRHPIPLDAER